MKRFFILSALALLLTSCGVTKDFLESYSPEENGLNMMKITDENNSSILGSSSTLYNVKKAAVNMARFEYSLAGGSKFGLTWYTGKLLDISPDGSEIAYLTRKDKQDNIMIKRSMAMGPSTQRTFRNVSDFSWGYDDNLYYSDCIDSPHQQLSSTNAHIGNLVRQLSTYNMDSNPVLTDDKSILFFTRLDTNGPTIWSLELATGALTSCARGYNPAPIPGSTDSFVCVRNSSSGVSELWLVNFVLGQETLLLTDKEKGFTNPCVSRDGQWIVFTGSSKSLVSKTKNMDVYVMKTDGSNFAQLTYHPGNDCCPVWSPEGDYIYFISSRANKNKYYNIWRMRFER